MRIRSANARARRAARRHTLNQLADERHGVVRIKQYDDEDVIERNYRRGDIDPDLDTPAQNGVGPYGSGR